MKGKIYKIKSNPLIRKWNSYPLWSKSIPSKKYRVHYKEYRSNPSDKAFFEEYKTQITLYENALSELKKSYSKLPNSKNILDRLDNLQEKKNTLMQEYSSSKPTMDELYKIRKNYGIYMGKEMER